MTIELKVPLSAYIRTLNEERRIGDVIRAAKAVASDIVIVDSGSSDDTLAIAASLGARIIAQPWLGNGRQKRVGENACRHDWLLDLDADEIVTPELADEIAALFKTGAPNCSAYSLKLITAPPIGAPWRRAAVTRRFKLYNRKAIRAPDHAAWDQFDVPPGMSVGALKSPLLHYSFEDFEHFTAKLNRVSTARARGAALKPFWVVASRVVFAPPFYFLKHYLMRGLWREGLYGFAIAGMSAHGRWLRDIKMLERHLRARSER